MQDKRRKFSIDACFYHLCRQRTQVHKCNFCRESFCKTHLRPKPAGLPRFKSARYEDRLYMEEWHKPDGHPCIPYMNEWLQQQKERAAKYRVALDKLLKSRPVNYKDAVDWGRAKRSFERPSIQRPEEAHRTKQTSRVAAKNESYSKLSLPFMVKLLIPTIVIAATLSYLMLSSVTEKVIETVPRTNVTLVNETLQSEISFRDYINDVYKYDNKSISLKGFLERYVKGDEAAGVYTESIVDDYENRIDLTGLTAETKAIFPKKGKTNELYLIEGVFQRKFKTLQLKATSINLSARDLAGQVQKQVTIQYQENLTRTIAKPRYPFVRNFVLTLFGKSVACEDDTLLGNCSITKSFYCSYNGLVRNPTECGCPEGERFYEDGCIREVKCLDGTLEPECSKDKPRQCISGNLIDNADECGCPEDYKKVERSCEKIQRCSDGTIYEECSKNKPFYCEEGDLIKRASECGCTYGYVARENECIVKDLAEAQEAFDYVNRLRKEYFKGEIKWDNRAYKLAVNRAKDLNDRNYFDHVTPDGTCVKDMKTAYGFQPDEILAENLGGMTHYSDGSTIAGTNPKEAVDSWMSSRGHRYNLLYDNHISGAIGCYRNICVFLGVHNGPYGLGAGSCATGAEGSTFWKNAEKQEGEA